MIIFIIKKYTKQINCCCLDFLHFWLNKDLISKSLNDFWDTLYTTTIVHTLTIYNIRYLNYLIMFFFWSYSQRMTSYEGYAWFLPAWLPEDWWDVDYYNSPPSNEDNRPQETVPCSTEQMEYAIEGHFILSKSFYNDNGKKSVAGDITVEKFRRLYADKVGKAVSCTNFLFYFFSRILSMLKLLPNTTLTKSIQDQFHPS